MYTGTCAGLLIHIFVDKLSYLFKASLSGPHYANHITKKECDRQRILNAIDVREEKELNSQEKKKKNSYQDFVRSSLAIDINYDYGVELTSTQVDFSN